MAQANIPFLDLSVMDALRVHMIAPHAAILFDTDLDHVLWTNAEGAALIGASSIGEALDSEAALGPVLHRQIAMAARKLDRSPTASGTIRTARGFKTRLIGFTLSNCDLAAGGSALLLVSEDLRGRGVTADDLAQDLVDALDSSSHASAVLRADGSPIAKAGQFDALALDEDDLSALIAEAANETDRLVKRRLKSADGGSPAGIGRLSDDPATYLLVVAEAEEDSAEPEVQPAAEKAPETTSEESEEPSESDEAAAPSVGAFSNRRDAPGRNSMGRWYYRSVAAAEDDASPTEEVEETATDTEEAPSLIGDTDTNLAVLGVPDDGAETEDAPTAPEPEKDDIDDTPPLIRLAGTEAAAPADEPLPVPPESETATEPSEAEAAADDSDFTFTREARPIRFVWEMDADQTFKSVSSELAQAVGPDSAAIAGSTWEAVGETRGLENAGEIARLLDSGDTWSGKTVLWPVEGTDLRVPIDLAGLPSYGRDRSFEGFTGFGIVRTADAVIDPEASPTFGSSPGVASEPDETTDEKSDKVVDIAQLREKRTDRGLSSGEEAAFREIGETLNDGADKTNTDKPAKPAEQATSLPADFVPSAFARIMPPQAEAADDTPANPKRRASNVDTSILERLPIPVLVYRDDDLLFGNGEFFSITGHDGLDAFEQAGGLEALFGNRDHANDDWDEEAAAIYHRDGKRLNVRAHIQRVPWDEQKALLLTLRRDEDADEEDTGPPVRAVGAKPDSDGKPANDAPADNRPRLVHSAPPISAPETPTDTSETSFAGLEAEDLRGVLDVATDGVIILTDEGIVKTINRSAEALFDIEPDEIVGRNFNRLLAPESRGQAADYIAGLTGPGVASVLNDGREVIGVTDRGGLIPLFLTIGKLERTGALCAVLRDITHWKKAEEDLVNARAQAESANAQKSDFLAKISHEVRTPLNAIIGFSDLMIEERFGRIENDRYRGYLRDIRRSGNHVLDLVNDLLDISKIEAGKAQLEFDACDLNALVAESVALTQPDANKERVIIRTSLSAMVPNVVADPRSLRQIVLNLVSNAIKFTKSGGQVIVSTVYDASGEVVLRVRDTGVGMSKSDLARAMKPFQQLATAGGAQKQGTGLGLPLTKALVEANRARFSIESQPDDGTLVEIYFPSPRVLADR